MPSWIGHQSATCTRYIYNRCKPSTLFPNLHTALTDPDVDSPSGVVFMASNTDAPSSAPTESDQESPTWLFVKDVGTLLTMLKYLPHVFLPFKSTESTDEFCMDREGVRRGITQALLFIIESILLIAAIPAALLLPGLGTVLVGIIAWVFIYLIADPDEGRDIITAQPENVLAEFGDKHDTERWAFINGCATDFRGLERNIQLIAHTFGREVTGIHNKSFGLIGDMLECLIQRCFAYRTRCVRTTHLTIKPWLMDPDVSKVVLLAHSQGGIIISLVLDQLFSELPQESMSKLEIYTFGSAASHFPNPLLRIKDAHTPPSPSAKVHFDSVATPAGPKHVIAHIEHYANEYDMVPRWGVLNCAADIQANRYAGSVFVHMGASGHMFNQHYLSRLFPLDKHNALFEDSSSSSFLDSPVDTDTNFLGSQSIAHELEGVLKRKTGLELGDGHVLHAGERVNGNKILSNGHGHQSRSPVTSGRTTPGSNSSPSAGQRYLNRHNSAVMIFTRTGSGFVIGEEACGKTVRELSRLWRYLAGGSPDDPLGGVNLVSTARKEKIQGMTMGTGMGKTAKGWATKDDGKGWRSKARENGKGKEKDKEKGKQVKVEVAW